MTPTITAQVLVGNEENWVWYAINSILDWVDQVLVWDTGSTDKTVNIIKSISSPKIRFAQKGQVDPQSHSQLRQKMLEETTTDWFLILDGDEIWWRTSISRVIKAIQENPDMAAIISPFYNVLGDIFHYQKPSRSHYQIHQYHGSYTIRAINRNLPGLHLANPHGRQEYKLADNTSLQKLPLDQLLYVDAPYLHTTHLHRSSNDTQTLKRGFKFKFELGTKSLFFPPEVFYLPHPNLVPSPFKTRSWMYTFTALLAEPVRIFKNMFFNTSASGY